MVGRAARIVADCLFPFFCVACGAEGAWWCASCRGAGTTQLRFFETPLPLSGLMAIFSYQSEGAVGRLIQQFKYNYGSAIAELWKDVLPLRIETVPRGASVVPVPLFPRRERERGYNQAAIIGKLLAGKLAAPFAPDILERVRATRQQARLSRTEREDNVRNAFSCLRSAPQNIILVDDVYTTGATMAECARALRVAGAEQVFGFVLAKGE